jgi:hypothetical protein
MDTAITEFGNAFNGLSTAFGTHDFDTIHAACTRLGDSGRDLSAILPSPYPKMTAASQRAVDEIAATESDCLAIGPLSTDSDYERLEVELSQLHDYMTNPGGK